MRQKTVPQTSAAEKTIKDIRRATRKHHSSEEKIRRLIATRSPFVKGIGLGARLMPRPSSNGVRRTYSINSTTTPGLTIPASSSTSQLASRTHPCEPTLPISSGSGVP